MRASVLLLAAASVAFASAETVEILGFGADVVVYSVGSDATATTYLMGCPIEKANDCLFTDPFPYTIGPSRLQMTSVMSGLDLTLKQDCDITGKTQLTCTVKYEGPGTSDFESIPGATGGTITMTGESASTLWGPATVVTDIASMHNGDRASLPPTTGAGVTSAPTSTPTSTAETSSGAVDASESTGGMPQITGSSGWAVGGVAAAVALAAF
ncbi:hypothetical protein V493_05491 [Pseudogymnoascus sp. VKM F-4281 (FW-2241)]|nr:hypothetical protein V493_05491 [Pseudogymnoascus sp. VKM F-4281 (FW-2241)]